VQMLIEVERRFQAANHADEIPGNSQLVAHRLIAIAVLGDVFDQRFRLLQPLRSNLTGVEKALVFVSESKDKCD
jgi:hypothetical protein